VCLVGWLVVWFCFVCLFVCLVVWLVGWLVVVVVASGGVVVFVLVVFSQSIRSNSDQTHPSFGQ
jgi:ABC-type bacteriocin/lantibiotic exporter with double-glycine peptidase domain